MYCTVCSKHGKGNTSTASCKTSKTTSMMRHKDIPNHKHALAARESKANFDTALSKAFTEEHDEPNSSDLHMHRGAQPGQFPTNLSRSFSLSHLKWLRRILAVGLGNYCDRNNEKVINYLKTKTLQLWLMKVMFPSLFLNKQSQLWWWIDITF